MADSTHTPGAGKHPIDRRTEAFLKETRRDTGYRKAAEFLMVLGKDEAARVLKHMSQKEIEGITREIARIEKIGQKDAAKILEEFGFIRETRDLLAQGGVEKAREMLVASVGEEKAEEILARVKKEMAPPPFTFLKDVDPQRVGVLLADESPFVIAAVLPHLPPRTAGKVLSALDPEVQKATAGRIARMDRMAPEALQKTEEVLLKKLQGMGTEAATEAIDGRGRLTEILRHMDPAHERSILEDLEPNTAEEIRKKLLTVDAIARIPERDLQGILRDYADREIAILTKGLEEPLAERLLANVSERRREFIRLETGALPGLPRAEVDRAIDDFLSLLRIEEQSGRISIPRADEPMI